MLVEQAGGRVLIHPSPPGNLKVTTCASPKPGEGMPCLSRPLCQRALGALYFTVKAAYCLNFV
jgi:hypothetical protein